MSNSNQAKRNVSPKVKSLDFDLVLHELLEVIDTPKSLAISLLLRNKEFLQLFSIDCKPSDYCAAIDCEAIEMYRKDSQAIALVKKNPNIGNSINLKRVAIRKFIAAERKCKDTNVYLRTSSYVGKTNLAGYLFHAQNFIRRVLGASPRIVAPDFGPGASSACRGFDSTYIDKLRTNPECTIGCRPIVAAVLNRLMPGYCAAIDGRNGSKTIADEEIQLVSGNRFTTVPKDSRGDRGICIEPHGNIIVQKGIGNYIRKRLRKKGWDLNNLDLLHGWYAEQGSKFDHLSTIDLSSASDTISYELVKALLPGDWFILLDRCRSRRTQIKGSNLKLEKFSSMGNGFTFELESLIFLSLCHAVSQLHGSALDTISVFGDDIVIDRYLSKHLIDVLKEVGFDVNQEKSFLTGDFKESCGQDYFSGIPVRPIFIKEPPKNEVEKRYYYANRIREIARCSGLFGYCDIAYKRVWSRVVDTVPYEFRCFGPSSDGSRAKYSLDRTRLGKLLENDLGDQVIYSEYRGRTSRYIKKVSYLMRVSRKVKPLDFTIDGDHLVIACALYGVQSTGCNIPGAGYSIVKRYTSVTTWSHSGMKWI